MNDFSIALQLLILVILLLCSALFSGSETAMMAANRYRLRHQAQANDRLGAHLALALLDKTDKLMGFILVANTLINAAAVSISVCIAISLLGNSPWAFAISTLSITFLLLIFSEISPKVAGAAHADKIAPVISYLLTPLLRLASPITWFVNLFVTGLLRLLHISPQQTNDEPALTPTELRSLVLESAKFIPPQHRRILSNLFELDSITVEDVMTPRSAIEILDLARDWDDVLSQLLTSHHNRLPVCRESLDHLLGVLPVRRLLGEIQHSDFNEKSLAEHLQEPYYIPAGTPAYVQLAFFQESRRRFGFIIDEYGEILGLLTLEDIIEEIVGQFTTSLPEHCALLRWDSEACAVVDGSKSLREINRLLGIDFPTDGPKTLNGLILEHFQDIPEPGVSFKIAGIQIEVLQTHNRSVRTAKLFQP